MTENSTIADRSPNPNLAWADSFVSELAACGLTHVCIAPGSRSTPLTLAFSRHPSVRSYLHLDERSAAFFALGLALATERPVALVCTSGTAAAEFFGAIIEARQSHVPLLILTADRPHELRYSGANQTVDQVKMYGDNVLWSFDMALPATEAPAVVVRSVQSLAARAYHVANGMVKGPVHLNFPFRKPLEPDTAPLPPLAATSRPAVEITRGTVSPSPAQIENLSALIQQHERGLIVCGPGCAGSNFPGDFPRDLAALARAAGYPIFADPLSGVRFGPAVESGLVVGGYESFLRGGEAPWGAPDLVIRFGAVPTSKWLNAYLEQAAPAHLVHIRENGIWADDLHRITQFLQADAALVCREVVSGIPPRGSTNWTNTIVNAEEITQQTAQAYCRENFFDGAVVSSIVEVLPPGTRLFIGNSLPVRHLDQFGAPVAKSLTVYGNRGASGIDGIISTALGIAAATSNPLVLVIGDISFYHDMNGLLALRQHDLRNVTIVLLNNDGGSIFRRLPVAKFEPPFTDLFLTPHGLDFAHVAQLYGLEHVQAQELKSVRRELARSVRRDQPGMIEVRTDGEADLAHQREVVGRVGARI